jgi:fructose-specific phosphotransferase system component IIB
MYEMGPTIQENNAMDIIQEYTKNLGVVLKVETQGLDSVLKVLEENNRFKVVEHDC